MFNWDFMEDVMAYAGLEPEPCILGDSGIFMTMKRTMPLVVLLKEEMPSDRMMNRLKTMWNLHNQFPNDGTFTKEVENDLVDVSKIIYQFQLLYEGKKSQAAESTVRSGSLWAISFLTDNELKTAYNIARQLCRYKMLPSILHRLNERMVKWEGRYDFIANKNFSTLDRMRTFLVLLEFHHEYFPLHGKQMAMLLQQDPSLMGSLEAFKNAEPQRIKNFSQWRHLMGNLFYHFQEKHHGPIRKLMLMNDALFYPEIGAEFLISGDIDIRFFIMAYRNWMSEYTKGLIPHPLRILNNSPTSHMTVWKFAFFVMKMHLDAKFEIFDDTHLKAFKDFWNVETEGKGIKIFTEETADSKLLKFTPQEKQKLLRFVKSQL